MIITSPSERLDPFRFPGVRVLSASTALALTLETLRSQCEVVAIDSDGHPDDDLLVRLGKAAVASAEKFTGRCLLPRRYEMALDGFPRVRPDIEIPHPPFVALVSVTYGGEGSDAVALTEGESFTVDPFGDLTRLRPIVAWPSALTLNSGVRITWDAGYSPEGDPDSDREELPSDIRAALLLTVEHLYRNRGATTDKPASELPMGVEYLLRPHRVLTGFA